MITQLADADNDTKVQLEESADEDKILFNSGDTERMNIDSDGDVGIGISPSTKKLQVFSGEIQIDNMGADNLLLIKAGDSANYNNIATLGLVSGYGDYGYDHYSYIRCINNGTSGTGESYVNLTFGKTINNLSDVEFMRLTSDGQLGIGTTSPDPSAIVDISSTSMGFLPPRISITQINAISSPEEGLTVFNTTNQKLVYYNGIQWANYDGTVF